MSLEATPCRVQLASVQNVSGTYTNHVSESVDKIQFLQNNELTPSVFQSLATNLLQDLYGTDGRWATATKCMGNDTEDRTSDVSLKISRTAHE